MKERPENKGKYAGIYRDVKRIIDSNTSEDTQIKRI
jgi:hypothetical protein